MLDLKSLIKLGTSVKLWVVNGNLSRRTTVDRKVLPCESFLLQLCFLWIKVNYRIAISDIRRSCGLLNRSWQSKTGFLCTVVESLPSHNCDYDDFRIRWADSTKDSIASDRCFSMWWLWYLWSYFFSEEGSHFNLGYHFWSSLLCELHNEKFCYRLRRVP